MLSCFLINTFLSLKEIIMNEIKYTPIGTIHSQFKEPKGTPIQPSVAKGNQGTIEIIPEFVEGLKDVEGFSHIILLFHFHLARKPSLKVKPYLDNEIRGVFSTRAPSRPNPIGISIVRLIGIEDNILKIQDVDIVDGTPLLDIKPYVPTFDVRETMKIGWLENNIHKLSLLKDDGRFTE